MSTYWRLWVLLSFSHGKLKLTLLKPWARMVVLAQPEYKIKLLRGPPHLPSATILLQSTSVLTMATDLN